jgi:hypothetical protein
VTKALVFFILSFCLCVPGSAQKHVTVVDKDAIKEEIRSAVRDLQIQLPELVKAIRIGVQIPDIEVHVSEIKLQLPEIQLPEIHFDVPINVRIPAISIPEIRIQIPPMDIHLPDPE